MKKRTLAVIVLGATSIGGAAWWSTRAAAPAVPGELLFTAVSSECDVPDRTTRAVVLHVDGNGRYRLNMDQVASSSNLMVRLSEIYETRREQLLFLQASAGASRSDVTEAARLAKTGVPALRLVEITPEMRLRCEWLFHSEPAGGGAQQKI